MPAHTTANASGQPALDDPIHSPEAPPARSKVDDALNELRDRAGQVAQETLDNLRLNARPYVDQAGERLAVAERYLVDRVQRQPVSTTLAVLGVGVLIGLVLSGGRRN